MNKKQHRTLQLHPSTYFLLSVALMVVLNHFVPVARWSSPRIARLGIIPVLASIGLSFWAGFLFRRNETTVHPFKDSRHLVTDGPYRVTRNPMYTSLLCVLIGLAFWLEALTPVVVPPLFVWVMTKRIIEPEEQRLEAQFGDVYRAYRQRVRRWV